MKWKWQQLPSIHVGLVRKSVKRFLRPKKWLEKSPAWQSGIV
jgi:hypothetical protein